MKQKCPTCNAGTDKDIFGMCSECGTINRPYEDLPEPVPHTAKKPGCMWFLLACIAGLSFSHIGEWMLSQDWNDSIKVSSILTMGFVVGYITAYATKRF